MNRKIFIERYTYIYLLIYQEARSNYSKFGESGMNESSHAQL